MLTIYSIPHKYLISIHTCIHCILNRFEITCSMFINNKNSSFTFLTQNSQYGK